jgi:hypothetical protein
MTSSDLRQMDAYIFALYSLPNLVPADAQAESFNKKGQMTNQLKLLSQLPIITNIINYYCK